MLLHFQNHTTCIGGQWRLFNVKTKHMIGNDNGLIIDFSGLPLLGQYKASRMFQILSKLLICYSNKTIY